MDRKNFLSSTDCQVYNTRRIITEYAAMSRLWPAERIIFDKLRPEIRGKKLLDIGVGAGRTTPALLEISDDYSAIDNSPGMVQATRERFGLESVWCCDARDLSRFADCTFDFALFSWNGIDYITYPERSQVLGEVARVLRPGGIFVFSSHNRSYRDIGKDPWRRNAVTLTPHLLKECLKALVYLPRRLRLKRHEIYDADYAIVNDEECCYSLLTCYVTIPAQIRELGIAGFRDIEIYDGEGALVTAADYSHWLYYTARKHATTATVPGLAGQSQLPNDNSDCIA